MPNPIPMEQFASPAALYPGAEDFNSVHGKSFAEASGPTPIVKHDSPKVAIRANLNTLTIDLAAKREAEATSPVEFGAGTAQSPSLEYGPSLKVGGYLSPQIGEKTDAAVSGGQISSTHLISGKQSNLTLDAQNYMQMIVQIQDEKITGYP